MMTLMAAPFMAMFGLFGRYPYQTVAACAVLSTLAYVMNWGDGLALFACAGSSVLVWKVEADHPGPVEMGQGDAA